MLIPLQHTHVLHYWPITLCICCRLVYPWVQLMQRQSLFGQLTTRVAEDMNSRAEGQVKLILLCI